MDQPTPAPLNHVQTIDDIVESLRWDAAGLIPAVSQQYDTREVLTLAFMDAEALRRTLDDGLATYWSRSRQEYWRKGETSGNFQRVVSVRSDCDGDALLVSVDQRGVACHTGHRTCFDEGQLAEADVSTVGSGT